MKRRILSVLTALISAAVLLDMPSVGTFTADAGLYTENDGEASDELYCCIAEAEGDPLSQYEYAKENGVGSFIFTEEGKTAYNSIIDSHNASLLSLSQLVGREISEIYGYTAAYNGMAVILSQDEYNLALENLSALGLNALYVSDLVFEDEASGEYRYDIESDYSIESRETYTHDDLTKNILDTVGVDGSRRGDGTVIAVIDDSMEIDHEFFTLPDGAETKLSAEYVENISPYLSASRAGGSDFYYNEKIPFAFNYGTKTNDVSSKTGFHGTHVAGIAGGNGESETDPYYNAQGIAPGAQLIFMSDQGLSESGILAAVDDCLYLDVDVVNTSFGLRGAAKGAVTYVEEAMKNLSECGIIMCVSAGNSGKMVYDDPLRTPDYSTGGFHNNLKEVLSVGSAQNCFVEEDYIYFDNEPFRVAPFRNNSITKEFSDQTAEYIPAGNGLPEDYRNIDAAGKIAIVKLGDESIESQALAAKNAGAVGILLYDENSDLLFTENCGILPGGVISARDAVKFSDADEKTLLFKNMIMKNYEDNQMNEFSSWDFTEDLILKPEITGFGGDIISSYPGNCYTALSGTSMSTPQVSGISTLLKEYLSENKEKYAITSNSDYTEVIARLLMSTAEPIYTSDGLEIASPRVQGSGLANLENAVNTPAFLYTDSEKDNFRPKISMGDCPKKSGVFEFVFNIKNVSDETVSYDLESIVFSDSADEKKLEWNTRPLNADVTYLNKNGFKIDSVTVAPGEDTQIHVQLIISLKDMEYIEDYFPYGTYIDGFIRLKNPDVPDLTLPFMGFYGDWSEADLFEPFIYSKRIPSKNYSFLEDSGFNIAGVNKIKELSSAGTEQIPGTPCYSPDSNGSFNNIVVDIYFKRRCYDVTAKIYNSSRKKVFEQNLGYGNKVFNIFDYLMPCSYNLDWDFRDLDGEIHDGEIYTLMITAVVPATNKTQMISQEFIVDTSAPVVESCISLNVNGEKKALIKASDNRMLQGGILYNDETEEPYDYCASDENNLSQYIVLNTGGDSFKAEIYDIASNYTLITEKDLTDETYNLEYTADKMYFAADDKSFKNKISFTDENGNKISYNIDVTPEQVYKKGLKGFNIILGKSKVQFVEAKVGLRGDANCDGRIDVFDAVYVAKYTVSPNTEKYKNFKNSLGYCLADMKQDDSIDVFDAIAIAKYTVR